MQGLSFNRKRRTAQKKQHRRAPRQTGNLKFENRKRKLRFEKKPSRSAASLAAEIFRWGMEIAIVCAAAFLIVLAFGERVSSAGDSMRPTLSNGDVVLVNRVIYNIKDPSRGDVIVYRENENVHYPIKRVVGLPGETVQITDGSVYIDGEPVTKDIHVSGIEYPGVAAEPVELGEDEYFVIGDNAASSDDSRTPGAGNVTRDEIYGQAWFAVKSDENFGFIS